jgi:hypothetical protein
VVRLIIETFPEAPRTALAVAECESNLLMVQSNHIQSYGREESFGIFQVHARAWDTEAKRLGLDYINDVRDNIKMARHIYDHHGWQPWTCYSKNMIVMR